jgi:DNA invertase Pin-like site-specific DNA recombinase
MMNYIRDDDTVVVMALDRLSRDYDDVRIIINQIKDKGASLRILGMPDFSTMPSPFDKMMLDIIIALYSGIAENERNKILERQAQGIAIAKRKGAYKGKRTEYAADAVNPQKRAIYHRIVEMVNDGETAYRISKETGVNRRTIQRIAAELDEAE